MMRMASISLCIFISVQPEPGIYFSLPSARNRCVELWSRRLAQLGHEREEVQHPKCCEQNLRKSFAYATPFDHILRTES